MEWVLIIEPSDSNFDYLDRVTTRLGYRAFRARTAEEAVRFLGESIPDAVLCRDNLPDRDSLELARTMKADPMSSGIPLLMTSSGPRRFFRRKALRAGAAEVIDCSAPVRTMFEMLEMCISDSRRKMIRVPMSVPVTVDYQDMQLPFTTHTFGEGGLFVPTSDPIAYRALVGLEFTLPGINNLFDLRGEVAYVMQRSAEECPPGMGIRFLDVSRPLKTLLGVFLEDHLTSAASPA